MIALEAVGPSQTLRAAVDRLPGLIRNVSSFIKDRFGIISSNGEHLKPGKSIKILEAVNYSDARALKLYKSPGQKVTYMTLITTLSECHQELLSKTLPQVLVPFETWLSVQLTNPTELISIRNSASIRGYRQHNVDEFIKKLASCYDPKSKDSQGKLGELLDRNRDWKDVIVGTDYLNDLFSKKERGDIASKVMAIDSLLTTLANRIEENEEGYEMSGKTLSVLADICYSLAKEVEFYSVAAFNLSLHTTAVKDSIPLFEKLA
ncbi:MAG: hypothetical protein CL678_15765 [Bdellovibrionaceae bacterium]|nr:hypothetical protein [Pseudobdellovibrionaceae bacterium]